MLRKVRWLFAFLVFTPPSNAIAGLIWHIDPTPGANVEVKLADYEWIVDKTTPTFGSNDQTANEAGDKLRGIFKITTIQDIDTSTTYWSDGFFSTQELTGYFEFTVKGTSVSGSSLTVDFDSGFVKVFVDDSKDFGLGYVGPSDTGSASAFFGNGSGYSDGELWLDLVAVGGIVPFDSTIIQRALIDLSKDPITGSADGYLDIVGGSGAGVFAADSQDPGGLLAGEQDVRFLSDITFDKDYATSPAADYPVTSHDPMRGRIVPEPGTITLWTLGIIFGVTRAKKRRRQQTA